MKTFRLPDLGEGLQEAEISAWHVKDNDDVTEDQPLLSVETEKAIVDIPSPRSGRIKRLLGKPGDILAVGAPLVEFFDGEDAKLASPEPLRESKRLPRYAHSRSDSRSTCRS
jgi:2-oxoisovalerate dehydrogenase E2 component (dihydrolipoyl transacylase)